MQPFPLYGQKSPQTKSSLIACIISVKNVNSEEVQQLKKKYNRVQRSLDWAMKMGKKKKKKRIHKDNSSFIP